MHDTKTDSLAGVHVANYHQDRLPAVNVKDRAWHGRLAAELDVPDDVGNALWDELRESFWESAVDFLIDEHFGSGVRFYSEGRSGGWLAVDLGYEVDLEADEVEVDWDDEDDIEDYMAGVERLARFLDFARDARREADYYSGELMEERLREWAEERDAEHDAGRGTQ
jgi:hypothetical protein